MASYAVPVQGHAQCGHAEGDFSLLWGAVLPDGVRGIPGVEIRTEVVAGLAARILLERCADADMLVLGTAGDCPGPARSAGPVIRACLRRSPCPVVVISAAQDPLARAEAGGHPTDLRLPAHAGAVAAPA
jgi:hypothetical protein